MFTITIVIMCCVFVVYSEIVKEFGPQRWLQKSLPNATLDDDDNTNRIIGGVPAELGEFPFQASLRYSKGGMHYCGGVIITSRFILTAAHCVDETPFFVVVGTVRLSIGGVKYEVEYATRHQDYVPTVKVNDIALAKVMTDIQFSPIVNAAKLPTSQIPAGAIVQVSGWGWTRPYEPSEYLMKLSNYPIFDLAECMKYFHHEVHPGKICSGIIIGQGTCKGDSGGPLSIGGTVVGIVSHGKPCAIGYPDVFANVLYYLTWIMKNTESHVQQLRFE